MVLGNVYLEMYWPQNMSVFLFTDFVGNVFAPINISRAALATTPLVEEEAPF
jgi:hypothetical protein